MAVLRSPANPLIKPLDVHPSQTGYEVVGAFNAGCVSYKEEVLLLVRIAERPINHDKSVVLVPYWDNDKKEVTHIPIPKNNCGTDFTDPRVIQRGGNKYLTSISHFRLARSKDGIHFNIDTKPTLFPATEYEEFGIEDPRITRIENEYYITYSCISSMGICGGLIHTKDFISFYREGLLFHPDNKDVIIFPKEINGKFYALHRPSQSEFGNKDIWIAESPDLHCWGKHRRLIGGRENKWDSERTGGGTVPILLDEGWLEIYHGEDQQGRYSIGALLLDKDDPSIVLARSEEPLMTPEASYERFGFFDNVIFPCGAIEYENMLRLYYGASDIYIASADLPLLDIRKSLGVI